METLPLGYGTKAGMEGSGLSQGQRQRILLARMFYKEPAYIFLDEATNALDSEKEKQVMENLREFRLGRTALVIAHRLSTVRDADNIIVLEGGRIVEEGTHEQLVAQHGRYFELVSNQLNG